MKGALFLATWITLYALQGARAADVAFAVVIALALAWNVATGRAPADPTREE